MYQIDNSSARLIQPAPTAPGTPGFFSDGSPGSGIPATILPAEWLNSVQEELINAVEAAGITPDKTKFNQLAEAISQTPGLFLGATRISASGTFTPNLLTKTMRIRGSGGGGAGGGCLASTSTTVSCGSGGGCGAYAEVIATNSALSYAVVVGAGGTAVLGAAGNPGAASSFGSLMSLPGGLGGAASALTPPPFIGGFGGNSAAPTLTGVTALISIAGVAGGGGFGMSLGASANAGGRGTANVLGNAPNVGFGTGGNGTSNGASAAAAPGTPGIAGGFIVEEYA